MIRLRQLTKHYPGQDEPAVAALDLDVPEGEIVILVGPSGCGKTTTMKMINRLIEPTGGSIVLDGEDVTSMNPDHLRMRIGYVIQQVGLFPHQTIAQNIATVPLMLKWDGGRIRKRTDELLDLIGLDPSVYRDRYPKELSGGQRQRVGVARALSVDPPVMLMDEPFGAIDPITRERLQNEFLRLQAELRKTIVFVTHDIDEAIKMGDRIAIMGAQSRIAQYDTPERILASPADDFVADFIGAGASLKRLNFSRVRDVELGHWPTAEIDMDRTTILGRLADSDKGAVLILDGEQRPLRWASARDIRREDRSLEESGLAVRAIVEPQATLHHALDQMLDSDYGVAVVVDERGGYLGTVDVGAITQAIQSMRAAARAQARAEVHGTPAPVVRGD
jgi:osmoprotectant transport system ATP-binding protein